MTSSFTLNLDTLACLDELTDAQAGRLFKAIRDYWLLGPKDVELFFDRKGDTAMRAIFAPFRAAFDRDQARQADLRAKRAASGRIGGINSSKTKQNKQTQANASKCYQVQANASNNDNNNINNYNYLSLSKEEIAALAQSPLSDCWRELRSDQAWREVVTINTQAAGYDWFNLDQFDIYLDAFFRELQNRDTRRKSASDAKHHFSSWLKTELNKQNNGTNRKTSKTSSRSAKKQAASATEMHTIKL